MRGRVARTHFTSLQSIFFRKLWFVCEVFDKSLEREISTEYIALIVDSALEVAKEDLISQEPPGTTNYIDFVRSLTVDISGCRLADVGLTRCF